MTVKGVDSASGFALGLLGTAMLINFMRGGPTQVKQWALSKFANGGGSAGGPPAAAPAPPKRGLPGLIPPPMPGGGVNPAPGGGAGGWGK